MAVNGAIWFVSGTCAGRRPHLFSTGTPNPFMRERVYKPKRCCLGTKGSP